MPRATSPRDIALLRLDHAHLPGWKSGLIPRSDAPPTADTHADAAFAEALYVGAVKRLLPLRWRIAHHAGRPLKAIDPLVQKILVLAAWQLTGLANVPAAIAVDQAVEQCRRFRRPKAAGMVNAVLRNFTRQPAPDIPPSLPLPEQWELRHGLPRAVSARLIAELGPEPAAAIAAHADLTPPTIVRLYSHHTLADLTAALASLPPPIPTCRPHAQPGLVVLESARREHFAALAERGLAQVQDPAAAAVAPLLDIQSHQRLLDRCCGNGTKTLHLRDLLGPTGHIDAVDPNPRRCQRLQHLLHARQLINITISTQLPPQPAPYDRILLDVPCSNSGVLARRPEARFHQSPNALASLLPLQRSLLAESADLVAPGGLLVYSTCSLWPDENAAQIRSFLQRDTRFVLRFDQRTLPACPNNDVTHYTDGGYVAVMVRDR